MHAAANLSVPEHPLANLSRRPPRIASAFEDRLSSDAVRFKVRSPQVTPRISDSDRGVGLIVPGRATEVACHTDPSFLEPHLRS